MEKLWEYWNNFLTYVVKIWKIFRNVFLWYSIENVEKLWWNYLTKTLQIYGEKFYKFFKYFSGSFLKSWGQFLELKKNFKKKLEILKKSKERVILKENCRGTVNKFWENFEKFYNNFREMFRNSEKMWPLYINKFWKARKNFGLF